MSQSNSNTNIKVPKSALNIIKVLHKSRAVFIRVNSLLALS